MRLQSELLKVLSGLKVLHGVVVHVAVKTQQISTSTKIKLTRAISVVI